MKKLWQTIGIIAYWLTVPGIWLVLRKTLRTRLVIRYKDQIVVVKPWLGNGKWCLPGGGVHSGESALSGVVREAKEEVGIELKLNNCTAYGPKEYRQNGLNFTYQLFGSKVSSLIPIKKQRIEIIEARWIEITSLTARNANQDVLEALLEIRN
jgi:8-oxo-dGTP pyrophosphatase MutT (NUDIX family)